MSSSDSRGGYTGESAQQGSLARNTVFNLVTQLLLIAVSLWSFPILVKGISAEGFGLLSLVWVLVGYFSLLDLGVSRAITKFVAESVTAGDMARVRLIVWTSLMLSVIIGFAVATAIYMSRGLAVTHLFNVTSSIRDEGSTSIALAAVGIPFMLANGMLRGTQAAFQRFDMVNGFQAVMGGMQWIGSVVLVWCGGGVKEIVLLTVLVRVLLLVAALGMLPRLIPGFFSGIRLWDNAAARKLLSFGGWVTVSQVISPLFLYADRLLIGSLVSLAAVAYYTVPQEAVSRMLIVPLSLTVALYPVFSAHSAVPGDAKRAGAIYLRSVKYIALLMLPVTLLFVIHARGILSVWMGNDFAGQSSVAFQILVVGVFFNSLAQVPTTLLHAFGRPDLTAKFHLLEFPVMLGLNMALIPVLGIAGAAIAWSLRVVMDAVMLFVAARPYVERSRSGPVRRYVSPGVAGLLVLIVLLATVLLFVDDIPGKAIATVALAFIYAAWVWRFGLDSVDKGFLYQMRTKILG